MSSSRFLSLGTVGKEQDTCMNDYEGGDRCIVAHFPPSLSSILDKSRSPPTLTTEKSPN